MSLRVFELAKELNIPTKELIKRISALGIKITGNFSALSDEETEKIKKDFLEPSTRIEELEVPSQEGVKKVRRRIISARKATEGKKIKASLKADDKVQREDVEETAAKKAKDDVKLGVQDQEEKPKAPKRIIRKKEKTGEEVEELIVDEVAEHDEEADKKKVAKIVKKKTEAEEAEPKNETEAEEAEPKKKIANKEDAIDTKKSEVKDEIAEPEKKKDAEAKKGEEAELEVTKYKVKKKEDTKPIAEKEKKEVIKKDEEKKVENKDGEAVEKNKKKETKAISDAEDKKVNKIKKKEKKQETVPDKEELSENFNKKQIKSLQKKEKVKLDKKSYQEELEEVTLVEDDLSNGFADAPPAPKPVKQFGRKRASKAAKRKERAKKQAEAKKQKHTFNPRQKELVVGEFVSVGDLAGIIGVKVPQIIKTLMSLGIMATITQSIDGETAALVASEHGVELKVQFQSIEDSIENAEDNDSDLIQRSPVVTIMGHVDHGKTSLLDKIRESNITGDEAGGITQHIGAYFVKTAEGRVTFLDTPGHEAFTAMRARGANVTDIVILVVAADDGPRPQTVEAIDHAKAANVAIIVAINKCDKPDANPDKTIQLLMEHELVPEEFGGDVPMIKVSAKTGDGIPKLLEMIHLQSEIMELKANPNRMAQGVVIESKVDKGKGNTATILIQKGTLRIGDNYVAGTEYGRVRAMWNDKGKKIDAAPPSLPVEIVGLNGIPKAGDRFNVGKDEKQVRQIAVLRTEKEKERKQAQQQKRTLENLFDSIGKEEKSILNLIVKTDVNGSLDALSDALNRLGNESVAINIVRGAVGAITSNDVLLATTSKAIIIGFNTRPDPSAKRIAQEESIDIRLYSVIYEAIEDVKKALEGMLKPIIREEIQGKAEVLEVFNIPKVGIIAGSKVVDGKFVRDCPVRVIRDNVIIHDGKLSSLQRFKDAAKEVLTGFECGIGVESYKDLRAGDELESYTRLETEAKL